MVSLSIHKENLTRLLVVTFKWNVLCCSQKSISNMCTLTRFWKKPLVKRTAAFSGIEKRAYQFDMTSDCKSIIRSQRHEILLQKKKKNMSLTVFHVLNLLTSVKTAKWVHTQYQRQVHKKTLISTILLHGYRIIRSTFCMNLDIKLKVSGSIKSRTGTFISC